MQAGGSRAGRAVRASRLAAAAAFASIAIAAGCGGGESRETAAHAGGTVSTAVPATSTVEEHDASWTPPPAQQSAEHIYEHNCRICHRLVTPIGALPWYGRLHAPDLSRVHVTAARVRHLVIHGSGRMPAMYLRARQIHLIARYVELESHRPRDAPMDRRKRVDGIDVPRARQLFQRSCGTCHGLADAGTPHHYGESLEVLKWRRRDVEPSLYTGLGLMPSVHLTMDQIDRLAAYVARWSGTRRPSAQR